MSCVFITGKTNAKAAKIFLEKEGLYDRERKMTRISEEEVMIPIKEELGEQIRCKEIHGADKSSDFVIPVEGKIQHIDSQNVNQLKISPKVKLKIAIEHMLQEKGVTFNDTLHQDVCRHWEKHDDLVLLPEKSFTLDEWKQFGVDLWKLVAETLGVRRLAKKSAISSDGFRTPNVSLLYGDNGWITHVDNGIKYTFDVTKCMFSAGNISEKIRIGHFDCKGQTVVDLYAGIGYFVLPYLIHAKADMVYACEWNDNAIDALKKNLELNGVTEHCVIYEGDNKKFPLQAVADHVNLGLIPSSEPGWPVACAALRSDSGGWLHVHGNVTSGICGNEELDAAILPSKTSLQTNFKPSVKSSQLCLHDQAHVSKPTSTLMSSKCDERSSISSNMEQIPSSNKKIKPEWLDWACYVAESLLWHLTKSHENRNWNVHIQHIEHVKSYAPHIDHLVLDVECRPSQL